MAKLTVVKRDETPVRDFGNGLTLQILQDSFSGAKHLDMGTVRIPAGKSTPMHVRIFDEVIYMLRGSGLVQTEDGDKYELNAGDSVLIPAGTMHAHVNESDTELEQLYIFAPQAPAEVERSLRDLPIIS
ncbi:cupin domain-containing protein [Candidatus Saccharibacteria bacterium]|nr:cupin domain-containing protein [Candidatus Saccharibacteria bacterium]